MGDGIDALRVGDIVGSISGPGVTWPFSQFRYRVTSVAADKVGLEIVEPESKSSKARPSR